MAENQVLTSFETRRLQLLQDLTDCPPPTKSEIKKLLGLQARAVHQIADFVANEALTGKISTTKLHMALRAYSESRKTYMDAASILTDDEVPKPSE